MRPRLATLILGFSLALWIGISALAQVSVPSPPPPPPACAATGPSTQIGSTATETSFGLTCTIKAAQILSGTGYDLHVAGIYTAATGESATGRVHFNQTGTLNPATDATVTTTGALNGIAGATGQEWWGDIWITLYSPTSIDVQALLIFQATTNVTVMLGNTTPFTIDGTKDLTFYLTVQWGTANTGNRMQLRTLTLK